jgi:hypothetical protein
MNAVESEVDKLVEARSGSKLAEYILDSRTVSDFARTIAEETACRARLLGLPFSFWRTFSSTRPKVRLAGWLVLLGGG